MVQLTAFQWHLAGPGGGGSAQVVGGEAGDTQDGQAVLRLVALQALLSAWRSIGMSRTVRAGPLCTL